MVCSILVSTFSKDWILVIKIDKGTQELYRMATIFICKEKTEG